MRLDRSLALALPRGWRAGQAPAREEARAWVRASAHRPEAGGARPGFRRSLRASPSKPRSRHPEGVSSGGCSSSDDWPGNEHEKFLIVRCDPVPCVVGRDRRAALHR